VDAGPGRRSSSRSGRLAPGGHLDQLDVARTHTRCVGGGLADGQHYAVSPGMAAGSCCKLVGRRAQPERSSAIRQGAFQLPPAAGVTAVMAWRRVLQARVEQLCHRTNMGAIWRQPSRSPRQRPPAVIVTAAVYSGGAALHRPLGLPQPVQLRRQRPGAVLQILQIGVAVERPAVDTAGPTAPVAGLRSARTSVVGRGPARAAASLVDPRAGRDGDLPGLARLPAPHEASPPLAWLPGSNQPTEPAGTAQPERIAHSPYSPAVGPAGHGLIRSVPCRRWPTRPAPWRSQSPVRAAQQGRADKIGRRWSAWSRSHPRVARNGLCGDLAQHIHDEKR
jgi:hypothetical protein